MCSEWVGFGNIMFTWCRMRSSGIRGGVALILGFWNILKMVPPPWRCAFSRTRSERLQHWYRILFVAPMVIPVLIIVLIWRGLFFEATNGYLNQFLLRTHTFDLLGVGGSDVSLGRGFLRGNICRRGWGMANCCWRRV